MPTYQEIQAAALALAQKVETETLANGYPKARLAAVLGFQEAARVALDAGEAARAAKTSRIGSWLSALLPKQ